MKYLHFLILELTLAKECLERSDPLGLNYRGSQSTTGTRLRFPVRTCGKWKPRSGMNHNYCRNPDQSSLGPWCWVDKSERKPGVPPYVSVKLSLWSYNFERYFIILTTLKRDTAIFRFAMTSNKPQQLRKQ